MYSLLIILAKLESQLKAFSIPVNINNDENKISIIMRLK